MSLNSPWVIWLHPRDAYVELSVLRQENEEHEATVAALTRKLEDLQILLTDRERLLAEKESIIMEKDEQMLVRLKEAGDRERQYEMERSEWRRIESQLGSLIEKVEKMQEVKTTLERTNRMLREQLRARGIVRVEQSELIEPEGGSEVNVRMNRKENRNRKREEDPGNWLQRLPEDL